MCEFFFSVGVILFALGLPTFLAVKLIIMPAIQIRKAMKNGKTFKEAFKAEFPNNTTYQHNFPSQIQTFDYYSAQQKQGASITDYVSNPLYAPFSGNISHRS